MKRSASVDQSGQAGSELAEQFRVIAEIGGDIAFSIDPDSAQLRYASPAIAQLLGYTAEQSADAMAALGVVLSSDLAQHLDQLHAGAGSAARQVRVSQLQGAHAYPVPVEILSTLICSAAAEPLALVGVVRDLSAQRLRDAEQKRFASMLNHEFRTPLSTIDGAIQRLEAHPGLADEATRARYRKIALATDRLIGMLDEYLSPERMAGIGSARPPTGLAPQTLLDEGAAQLRAAGRLVNIEAGDLPAALRCDPDGLRLALKVLIDNAIAYAPGNASVTLLGRMVENGLELAVRDQGSGVPQDEQEHIFGKFYRGKNATGMPGSGLGLYMARSVIEVHGGVLSLVQPAAGGAEFRIWLPVAGDPISLAPHINKNSRFAAADGSPVSADGADQKKKMRTP